jgi:8-oxo-dGTP pyrophosphatase MutT (NUDIX family)
MDIKKDLSVGVIIFDKITKKYFCIKHKKGHWAFPKGHQEQNETLFETAKRELFEETNLDLDLLLKEKKIFIKKEILFRDSYQFKICEEYLVKKEVLYFLGILNFFNFNDHIKVDLNKINAYIKLLKEEVVEFDWLTFSEAINVFNFDESKNLLESVNKTII